MSERSVEHATFVVERTYDASPSRVFTAWADPAAKARWFGSPDAGVEDYELDFKVGGREFNRGTVEGQTYTFEARYQDIVPDERLVYAYEMHLGDKRISVSLGTVELEPEGDGTRLIFTEQGAFLDGLDSPAQREGGTGQLLDALEKELAREAVGDR
jgi:uncharacterized protein YndB with AHSA1/START domain